MGTLLLAHNLNKQKDTSQMNLEKAIKTAIDYEKKVASTYQEAEARAEDAVGKRIFKVLADEEQGHVDYLESRLTEWQRTGHVTLESLGTAIPTRERIQQAVASLGQTLEKKSPSQAEIDLLQRALEVELETSSFYRKVVSELDEEGRQLFARFLEIEQGHVTIVQAEIDSVKGLGFWFDMQEFQLEAE